MISMKKRDLSHAFNLPSLRIAYGLQYLGAAIANTCFAIFNPNPYRNWSHTALLNSYRSILYNMTLEQTRIAVFGMVAYQLITCVFFFIGARKAWAGFVGDWLSIAFLLMLLPMGEWGIANATFILLHAWLITLYIKSRREQQQIGYSRGQTSS